MLSLWEKIQTVFLAKAHSLLDQIIDLNSPEVVEQYIRKLENALDELDNVSSDAKAEFNSQQRAFDAVSAQMELLDKKIDQILADGNPNNDHLAEEWQLELNVLTKKRDLNNKSLEIARTTYDSMVKTIASLKAKRTAMVHQLEYIRSLVKATEAQKEAVEAVNYTIKVTSSTSMDSVKDLTERAEKEADRVGIRLTTSLDKLNKEVDSDGTFSEAQSMIEQRKARLAAKKAQEEEQPATSTESGYLTNNSRS